MGGRTVPQPLGPPEVTEAKGIPEGEVRRPPLDPLWGMRPEALRGGAEVGESQPCWETPPCWPCAIGQVMWWLLVALSQLDVAAGANLTVAVVLPEHNTTYPWAWPRVGPAIKLAIQKVNARPDLLPGYTVQLAFGTSEDHNGVCSDSIAPLSAVDMKMGLNPDVFVGPGCVYTSAPVARFTRHWGLPLVTAAAEAIGFGRKDAEYALITRTGPSHDKLGEFGMCLSQFFNWTSRAMLLYWDNNVGDRRCYFTMEGLYIKLPPLNITVEAIPFQERNYTALIRDIKQKARIVYVCCALEIFHELMVHAHHEGLTAGDYAFFYIDLFAESLQSSHFPDRRHPWQRGDGNDAIAHEAYKAVMIITYAEPTNPEYRPFLEEIKQAAQEQHNFTMQEELKNFIAAAFHDGVMLYAQAANETLELEGSISNATVVTHQMWNRTFYGVTGVLRIDQNGDRETDYSLWDMDPKSGEFEIVANYNGTTKKIKMVPGKSIHWPGNAIPRDVPFCGFENSNPACQKAYFSLLEILSLGMTLFLSTIIIAAFFVYRKMKLEKDLASELWRIHWEDVQSSNLEKNLRSMGSKLTLSLRGSNYGSLLTTEGQFQVYAKTAYYKGNLVAIKHVSRKRIDLTRNVLFELKHMRDVQNKHLTRFIGACIDPPNICILTEYCTRGSLQDILENDSITLDWMFRYSLTSDIVKGMLFLHNSAICSHGSLKSSNCVVDSRFVLKITDYGLASFRQAPETDDSHALFASERWRGNRSSSCCPEFSILFI